ncbi:MAG: carboxy-S-adenosyl-L-methionine synthase CmoA [Bacteriovoracaceae bacterium]
MTDFNKDQIYQNQLTHIPKFEFNQAVANVFDDMVQRSIPFYDQIHRIIIDLVQRFKYKDQDELIIYDLGCSTATTIEILLQALCLSEASPKQVKIIGVDQSKPMIEKATQKLKAYSSNNYELHCQDLNEIDFQTADMVIMNYTLQFISVGKRVDLLTKIFRALKPGGLFLLSEKIKTDNPFFEELFIELYYDFKRGNGYNELEISQKREALENVLVPLTPAQQLEFMSQAGLQNVEMLFRWYNFASFLGIKPHAQIPRNSYPIQ